MKDRSISLLPSPLILYFLYLLKLLYFLYFLYFGSSGSGDFCK